MARNNGRIYVGIRVGQLNGEVFRSGVEPTAHTHGLEYACTIGPFRTMRGARWMADPVKGRNNPHCRCVADAERLAKQYA